jgi:MtN3 and saliva related transmembrane protein
MRFWVEFLGSSAAVCTTLCWAPQAAKIIREKQTGGISVVTQTVFTLGVALWAVYGFLVHRWPLLAANIVTFALSLTILLLKFRYPVERRGPFATSMPKVLTRQSDPGRNA